MISLYDPFGFVLRELANENIYTLDAAIAMSDKVLCLLQVSMKLRC